MHRAWLTLEHRGPLTLDADEHLVDPIVDLLADLTARRDAHDDDLAVRSGRQHLAEPGIGLRSGHDVLVERHDDLLWVSKDAPDVRPSQGPKATPSMSIRPMRSVAPAARFRTADGRDLAKPADWPVGKAAPPCRAARCHSGTIG